MLILFQMLFLTVFTTVCSYEYWWKTLQISNIWQFVLYFYRIFQSSAYRDEHLAVFHAKYISDSTKVPSQKIPVGKYFLPPKEIQNCNVLFIAFKNKTNLTTVERDLFVFNMAQNEIIEKQTSYLSLIWLFFIRNSVI